jgi:hypothetical protein
MAPEHTPASAKAGLYPIVERISAIWKADEERARVPRDIRATGLRIVRVSDLMVQAPTSRLESVRDAGSGLRYSVWLAGETIARLAGIEAARSVYTLFEERNGSLASAWLNTAWTGISDGTEAWSGRPSKDEAAST